MSNDSKTIDTSSKNDSQVQFGQSVQVEFFKKAVKDPFGGLTIDIQPEETSMGAEAFREKLTAGLAAWRGEKKRGIWLKLPQAASAFVDVAVKLGFGFHHAKEAVMGNAPYLMMTNWLPEGETNPLPKYPHHQIGAGGMVVNSRGEVLVIQEKIGITAGRTDFWKLPGGLVDIQEDIATAAKREVYEETGIRAVFKTIASVRESHQGPHGSTDLYMVCVMGLDPEVYGPNDVAPTPNPQEEEIANAEWQPLEKFLNSKYYATGLYGDMLRVGGDLAMKLMGGASNADSAGKTFGLGSSSRESFGGKFETLYFGGVEPKDESKNKANAKL